MHHRVNLLQRTVASVLFYTFFFQVLFPLGTFYFPEFGNRVFAQGGQPESTGYSLSSTDGLVNKFTGDFTYSIPLMNVEGYPITIQYDQNVGMDSEASWVGLGWNLSLGAINRQMRGLPDEFNSNDKIERASKTRDYTTNGYKLGMDVNILLPSFADIIGLNASVSFLKGSYDNSYNGRGVTHDFSISGGFSLGENPSFGANLGLGYTSDSQNGIGRSSSIGVSANGGRLGQGGLSFSSNRHSRSGVNSLGLSANVSNTFSGRKLKVLSKFGGGFGTSSSISLGSVSSVPSLKNEMIGSSNMNVFEVSAFAKLEARLGAEATDVFQKYSTSNEAKSVTYKQLPIGYLHSSKRNRLANKSDYPVMDMSYTVDHEVSTESKVLPFSAPTYDIFTYSGMGNTGQFRAQRRDVGALKGATRVSSTAGKNNRFSIGFGFMGILPTPNPAVKIGYSRGSQKSDSRSGVWDVNGAGNFHYDDEGKLLPNGNNSTNGFDGAVFFKNIGELTPTNKAQLDALDGVTPIFQKMERISKNTVGLSGDLVNESGTFTYPATNVNAINIEKDPIRATDIRMETAEELGNAFFQYKNVGETYLDSYSFSYRNDVYRKPNHISKAEMKNASGMDYTYGIPSYEIETQNVSFSVDKQSSSIDKGTVEYDAGIDNTVNNAKGKVQMFDKTTTSAYASSFLLTEVKSSDYVDMAPSGLSSNDQGNYYKFEYTKVYADNDPYTWRMPVSGVAGEDNAIAYFNEGLRGTTNDDVGSYVYGEKELYYVNSLESKNMVAQFHISERKDGYGQDENGFIRTDKKTYKLDKIELFNKNELRNGNKVPIQTVLFEYDYSLCPNFSKNISTYQGSGETGKLTLKKIRFLQNGKEESALAPFEFQYSDNNEDYSYGNKDRWGNYKENDNLLKNAYYPYVNQPDDGFSDMWKLTEIINPQGGKITVDYEYDEYAYTQDKRSMEFFDVVGFTNPVKLSQFESSAFGSQQVTELSSKLRTDKNEYSNLLNWVQNNTTKNHVKWANAFILGKGGKDNKKSKYLEVPNNVMVFKLDKVYADENTFIKNYFNVDAANSEGNEFSKTQIYTKSLVKIDNKEDVYESIPTFVDVAQKAYIKNWNELLNAEGMASISDVGLIGTGNAQYGYIVLKNDELVDNNDSGKQKRKNYNVHPIQSTSWQFGRLNLPDVVYADYVNGSYTYSLDLDKSVFSKGGLNHELNRKDFSLHVDLKECFVRLFTPDEVKRSSTARVRSITYYDNWKEMSNEFSSSYTWNYAYSLTRLATSGVADYEPSIGKDINPFYQWTGYKNINKSFPDEKKNVEEPFAELLFPAPLIGYGEVKVSYISKGTVSNTIGSGKSITYYHTSKDYPILYDRTLISRQHLESSLFNLFQNFEIVGLSQGFSVVTNDMHGKIDKVEIEDGLGQTQSETIYNYSLGKNLTYLNRSGEKEELSPSIEYDIYANERFLSTSSLAQRVGGDIYIPFPIALPRISPDAMLVENKTGYYLSTFNKIINQSAVITSVETNYLGSKNSAKNIAYDKFSGAVIVSSLKDEYEDELVNMSFPAHWKYPAFRNSAKAEVLREPFLATINGNELTSSLEIVEGDRFEIRSASTNGFLQECHVLRKDGNTYYLIDFHGNPINLNGSYKLVLFETGRMNYIGASMQSVTTKNTAFMSSSVWNPVEDIIANSAVTFADDGSIVCGSGQGGDDCHFLDVGSVANPFITGLRGRYRVSNSYALQTERANDQHLFGTRYDGTLLNYTPFYQLNNGEWYDLLESTHPNYNGSLQSYRKLGKSNIIDEYGRIVQTEDQIGVHSAVIFGYDQGLKSIPVAQAVNAEQHQIAFDGFEDYSYNVLDASCPELLIPHFSFKESGNAVISTKERHSGFASLAVAPGVSVGVEKDIKPISFIDECNEDQQVENTGRYVVSECDCAHGFSPDAGKYIVSVWVKVQDEWGEKSGYKPEVLIEENGSTVLVAQASGAIIDGWQKIESVFDLSSNSGKVDVVLRNKGSKLTFFDDFRIHPIKAGMSTTVYDPYTLQPIATHDGYNFTTFYTYDENKSMNAVRVETINGIQTISTQETGFIKRY